MPLFQMVSWADLGRVQQIVEIPAGRWPRHAHLTIISSRQKPCLRTVERAFGEHSVAVAVAEQHGFGDLGRQYNRRRCKVRSGARYSSYLVGRLAPEIAEVERRPECSV